MYICHEQIDSLSKREKQVLELLMHGLTAKMIAQRLFISPRTVEQHVGNIKTKIGVSSKSHLIDRMLQYTHEEQGIMG